MHMGIPLNCRFKGTADQRTADTIFVDDQQHLAAAAASQIIHTALDTCHFVGTNRVDVGSRKGQRIMHHNHRRVGQVVFHRAGDLAGIAERAAQADGTLDTMPCQIQHCGFYGIRSVADVFDEAVIAIAHQLIFYAMAALHLVQGINIIGQNTNGAVGLGYQVAGVGIRHVVMLFEQCLNFFPCRAVDPRLAVYYAGNRTGRDACHFGYIVNRHINSLLPEKFSKIKIILLHSKTDCNANFP